MEVVTLAKALSDGTRLRLLMALRDGELCVCQLVALVDLSTATVSKHLLVLKNSGFIQSRKEGRWIYYRIKERAAPLTAEALKWASIGWDASVEGRQDTRELKRICSQSPEEICQILRRR